MIFYLNLSNIEFIADLISNSIKFKLKIEFQCEVYRFGKRGAANKLKYFSIQFFIGIVLWNTQIEIVNTKTKKIQHKIKMKLHLMDRKK